MHSAILYGHSDMIPILLQAGANPNSQNNQGQTPLHMAILFLRPEAVLPLLHAKNIDLTIKDKQNLTPEQFIDQKEKLTSATATQQVKDDIAAIRKSFKDYYELKAKERQLDLWKALRTHDAAAVKKIMQQGPIKDLRDGLGNTALHIAVDAGDKDIVGLILVHNKDLAKVDNKAGETPIHRAIAGNKWDILELFRKLGFSEAQSKK